MISIGIDVSKRKSIEAILNVQGEVICSPFEFRHTKSGFEELLSRVKGYSHDEVKIYYGSYRNLSSYITRLS